MNASNEKIKEKEAINKKSSYLKNERLKKKLKIYNDIQNSDFEIKPFINIYI